MRFPNLIWGWRMPVKRLSWNLAWWLMTRVTMRGYTRYQQARMIHDALGAYKPTVISFGSTTTTTAGGNYKVHFDDH